MAGPFICANIVHPTWNVSEQTTKQQQKQPITQLEVGGELQQLGDRRSEIGFHHDPEITEHTPNKVQTIESSVKCWAKFQNATGASCFLGYVNQKHLHWSTGGLDENSWDTEW